MRLLAIAVAVAHDVWPCGPPTTRDGSAGLVVHQIDEWTFVGRPLGRGQIVLHDDGWPA